MTDKLAQCLRDNWSYEGLEVTGVSQREVTATVGPGFPISELVMHIGDPNTFNAVIDMTTLATGAALSVRPGSDPEAPRGSVPVAAAAVVALALAWLAPAVPSLVFFKNVTL